MSLWSLGARVKGTAVYLFANWARGQRPRGPGLRAFSPVREWKIFVVVHSTATLVFTHPAQRSRGHSLQKLGFGLGGCFGNEYLAGSG